MWCKRCSKKGSHFIPHYDGGYVCNDCIGYYFICPHCGSVYDMDDYEHGDALIDGKCVECAKKED